MATATLSSDAIVGFESASLAAELASTTGNVSIVSTPVHGSGAKSLEIESTSSGGADYAQVWGRTTRGLLAKYDNLQTTYIAFAIYVQSPPAGASAVSRVFWAAANDLSDKCSIIVNTDGLLRMQNKYGTPVGGGLGYVDDGFHIVGLEIPTSASNANLKVYLDGTLITTIYNQWGSDGVSHVYLGNSIVAQDADHEYTAYYDDFVLRDDQLPSQKLEVLLFASSSQSGCDTDWNGDGTDVDDAPPPGESDYVYCDEGGSSSDAETVVFDGSSLDDLNSDDVIEGIVNFSWIGCEGDPFIGYGNAKIKLVIGSTTDFTDAYKVSSSTFSSRAKVYFQNPADSAAWEKADLSSLQLGIEASSVPLFSGYDMREATVWLMVAREIPGRVVTPAALVNVSSLPAPLATKLLTPAALVNVSAINTVSILRFALEAANLPTGGKVSRSNLFCDQYGILRHRAIDAIEDAALLTSSDSIFVSISGVLAGVRADEQGKGHLQSQYVDQHGVLRFREAVGPPIIDICGLTFPYYIRVTWPSSIFVDDQPEQSAGLLPLGGSYLPATLVYDYGGTPASNAATLSSHRLSGSCIDGAITYGRGVINPRVRFRFQNQTAEGVEIVTSVEGFFAWYSTQPSRFGLNFGRTDFAHPGVAVWHNWDSILDDDQTVVISSIRPGRQFIIGYLAGWGGWCDFDMRFSVASTITPVISDKFSPGTYRNDGLWYGNTNMMVADFLGDRVFNLTLDT